MKSVTGSVVCSIFKKKTAVKSVSCTLTYINIDSMLYYVLVCRYKNRYNVINYCSCAVHYYVCFTNLNIEHSFYIQMAMCLLAVDVCYGVRYRWAHEMCLIVSLCKQNEQTGGHASKQVASITVKKLPWNSI